MIVNVTAEDIEKGVRESSSCCPIARAVERILINGGIPKCLYGKYSRPKVDRNGLAIGRFERIFPDEAQSFVDAFDDGLQVEPFSFEVERWQWFYA